ncbi:hypothetical protein OFO10_05950 [Campylobacter sp. VBCF_06 NA8]|uniref:hypothetical protein n=1 Tax=Campylobacter sp. VBCF_06 NA8 TaxID=2983822 RepID=UPI0022E99A01|nr:hypothetical protein [Campylobacter sp. VBCF_06 NA8]MDA3046697.1 hypothetical protein [Campylobacter sp. VBCF_06 NA8]
MAYIQGTANSIFDLLEVIKNLAVSQGWEVLGDTATPYNDIPRDARHCDYTGTISALGNSVSSASFNVIMPRAVSVSGLNFKGSVSVTIYGIDFDQTRELIAESVSSGYEFSAEVKAKKYVQFQVIPSGTIHDFHINFTCENEILERFVTLSNKDDSNNVIINLCAFIGVGGRANLAVATSTGFSPDLPIEEQLNTKLGYILSDDESIGYRINLNRHRLIISANLQRASETWQICYAGRLIIYGGKWALPDCNAIMATHLSDTRFNETQNANFNSPYIYFSGAFSQVSSTALSKESANATICNIDAPISGEIVRFPIICYRITNSYLDQSAGDIFGEMDGLYSVILPPNVHRGDEVSFGDQNFIVIAKGSDFSNPYESYIMAKE